MAFTQDQLDALDAAIATGSREVSFSGRQVTYRSLDEMMRIRETIVAGLGQQSRTTRYSLTGFTKDSTVPPPRCGGGFGENNIG